MLLNLPDHAVKHPLSDRSETAFAINSTKNLSFFPDSCKNLFERRVSTEDRGFLPFACACCGDVVVLRSAPVFWFVICNPFFSQYIRVKPDERKSIRNKKQNMNK